MFSQNICYYSFSCQQHYNNKSLRRHKKIVANLEWMWIMQKNLDKVTLNKKLDSNFAQSVCTLYLYRAESWSVKKCFKVIEWIVRVIIKVGCAIIFALSWKLAILCHNNWRGFKRGLWPILQAPLCNGLDPLNVPSVEFTTFDICTEYGRKIRSSGAGARKQ